VVVRGGSRLEFGVVRGFVSNRHREGQGGGWWCSEVANRVRGDEVEGETNEEGRRGGGGGRAAWGRNQERVWRRRRG
jgi:hypothetical protein